MADAGLISVKISADDAQLLAALKRSRNAVKNTEKEFDVAAATIKRFGVLAAAAITSQGVAQVVRYADEWTNLSNRLKLVTDSSEKLAIAQSDVFRIAQDTRQSLSSSAELYQRIAANADVLGLSLAEVSGVVKTISQTMAISGAAAESAKAALIQLGQAFASGTLRGEELNSVMEQAPALAKAIASGMGVTIGQLRELGKEGKLTSEQVIEALQKMSSSVDQDFNKTTGTVAQSFEQLSNSIAQAVGRMNEFSGASELVKSALSGVSETLDGFSDDQIGKLEKQLEALRGIRDDGGFWKGVTDLGSRDTNQEIADVLRQLDALKAKRDILSNEKPLKFEVNFDWSDAEAGFAAAGTGLERFSKANLDSQKAIEEQIKAIQIQAETIGMSASSIDLYKLKIDGATESQIRAAEEAYRTIAAFKGAQDIEQIKLGASDENVQAVAALQEKYQRLNEIVAMNPQLQQQALEAAAALAEQYQATIDQQIAAEQGRHQFFLDDLASRVEAIKTQNATEIEMALERYAVDQEMLEEALLNRVITEQEYNDLSLQQQQAHEKSMTDMKLRTWKDLEQLQKLSFKNQVAVVSGSLAEITASLATNNRKAFEINKAASIANAVVKGGEAIQSAWAAGMTVVGPWAPAVAAAYAAAAAVTSGAQIAAIASTQFGSGAKSTTAGIPSSANSMPSGAAAAGPTAPSQTLAVTGLDSGQIFDGKTVRALAEKLMDFQKDGGKVVFEG